MKSWCRDLGGNEALKTTAGAFTSAVMPGWAVERHSFVTSVRTESFASDPRHRLRIIPDLWIAWGLLLMVWFPCNIPSHFDGSTLISLKKIISVKSSWSQTYFFKFWWLTVDRVPPDTADGQGVRVSEHFKNLHHKGIAVQGNPFFIGAGWLVNIETTMNKCTFVNSDQSVNVHSLESWKNCVCTSAMMTMEQSNPWPFVTPSSEHYGVSRRHFLCFVFLSLSSHKFFL